MFPFCEVRFKNGRKGYYKTNSILLSIGNVVATQVKKGHDVGVITLLGELVRIQMKKKNINYEPGDALGIYRIASQKDIDVWQISRDKEEAVKVRARKLALKLELKMKISDRNEFFLISTIHFIHPGRFTDNEKNDLLIPGGPQKNSFYSRILTI